MIILIMGGYYKVDFSTWIIMVVLIIASCVLAIIGTKKFYVNQLTKKNTEYLQKNYVEIRNKLLEQARTEIKEVQHNITTKQQEYAALVETYEKTFANTHYLMEQYGEKQKVIIDKEVKEWAASAQEAANHNAQLQITQLQEQINQMQDKKAQVEQDLTSMQLRQKAVNDEILRSREIEEKQNFYRINLDESSKDDIARLLAIVPNFNYKETIYKLIWTEYLQKQFKAMVVRVLGSADPKNVIYMIKNLDTQEIYIGKTKAEVSKRWTEHLKTSLNIGSISRTLIHKALFNNWDRFAFCILEEVPEGEDLGRREKYYIDFYQSNKYGYNIKAGG